MNKALFKSLLSKNVESSGLGSFWRAVSNGRVFTQTVLWIPFVLAIFILSPMAMRYLTGDETAEGIGLRHYQSAFYAIAMIVTFHIVSYVGAQMNDNLFPEKASASWQPKFVLYLCYFFALCYLAVNAR